MSGATEVEKQRAKGLRNSAWLAWRRLPVTLLVLGVTPWLAGYAGAALAAQQGHYKPAMLIMLVVVSVSLPLLAVALYDRLQSAKNTANAPLLSPRRARRMPALIAPPSCLIALAMYHFIGVPANELDGVMFMTQITIFIFVGVWIAGIFAGLMVAYIGLLVGLEKPDLSRLYAHLPEAWEQCIGLGQVSIYYALITLCAAGNLIVPGVLALACAIVHTFLVTLAVLVLDDVLG